MCTGYVCGAKTVHMDYPSCHLHLQNLGIVLTTKALLTAHRIVFEAHLCSCFSFLCLHCAQNHVDSGFCATEFPHAKRVIVVDVGGKSFFFPASNKKAGCASANRM